MGKQLAGIKLVDGWESYMSAEGRRNDRRTQGLDPVIAERILSSMGPTGGLS